VKATVIEGFKTPSGKAFLPGDTIEAEPEKLKILESRGRVRIEVVPEVVPEKALSVGDWVSFGPAPDRTGQIVSSEEGLAIVRSFNQVGGFHDFRCFIDSLKLRVEPERPLLAISKYQVGDRVGYLHKTALNLQIGTIIEIKLYPASTWYRVRTGDTFRWVSEIHIQQKG
jgi:hypothetical protein